MADYRYLIVGGGMTADAACRGIREHDADGSIALVGAERDAPYSRPPLSKALWQGKDESSVVRGTADLGVDLRLGRRIVALDVAGRRAVDDGGAEYRFERVLLATGGRPRRLPAADDGVVYFRTLDDYRRLRADASEGSSAVVIGGGFIGSELAAALATNGVRVTMVFPEPGIGWRLFPEELSSSLNDYYRERGVDVLEARFVNGVTREGRGFRVDFEGESLSADVVAAGLGIEPAVELAEEAGVPVDDGIVVDEQARAGDSGVVFAAGDVARFPALPLHTTMRVEHEDHANSHGRLAGANMAGAGERYESLPFFYSDLFDLGYEAVGEVSSRHATVQAWAEPNRKGVVAYVDAERRPRGFLFWDVWGKTARGVELIRDAQPVEQSLLRELLE